MKSSSTPVLRDLVLVGGGHSHVTVLRRLGMEPVEGLQVTLVARDVHTPYSGMLPGLVAGHYTFDEAHIDLGPLARFAGARLIRASATGLDPEKRELHVEGRPPLPFDVLSINIGSTPRASDVPGAREHAIAVKPINTFLGRWEALLERFLSGRKKMEIAVVGAGAGGIELALAVEHRLREEARRESLEPPVLHLFSRTPEILPSSNRATRRKIRAILERKGLVVHAGCEVVEVAADSILDASGARHPVDETLWVTQAGAAPWPGTGGLATTEAGFIEVASTLESVSHPGIFAAGDVAHVREYPREKAGVFAVRQGPPLHDNLLRACRGEPLEAFTPQREFLKIIGTGDRHAVASRNGLALEGAWVWKLKDWIDRRFMDRFNRLPEMEEEVAPDLESTGMASAEALELLSRTAMRCGGCGAKVGATVLERVLARLERGPASDAVKLGLDSPDDAAVIELDPERLCVQTIDFFRSPVDDPYLFGKIAAEHALSDLFAMGASGRAALAVATVPFGLERQVETTLHAMLQGAVEVLGEAGVALVGGHSGEGAELALGFAITGQARREDLLEKAGLAAGNALILTKPLGTGTLLAADMRRRAKGRWITGALESMLRSNRQAAEILHAHGSRAATDVTGFGMAGHLLEMLRGRELGARIRLSSLPLLPGARELIEDGIFSSLQDANLRLRRGVEAPAELRREPAFALLFDPQTSGGLLAGVEARRAPEIVAALHEVGYPEATVVGEVIKPVSAEAPLQVIA